MSSQNGKFSLVWIAVASLAAALTGCGAGQEPFSMFQGADTFRELNLPLSGTFSVRGYGTGGSDGFEFYSYPNQTQVVSPGPGTITAVDANLDPGFYAITIYHNARLSSRISRVSAAVRRVGDYVDSSTVIGTIATYLSNAPVRMAVIVDGGSPNCPLSYLSSAARVTFSSTFGGGAYPCTQ